MNAKNPPLTEPEWRLETSSAAETQAIAAQIGQRLATGGVIALIGPLGAGKTSFVQGLAAGVGVRDLSEVVSPTYTLVNIYESAGLPLTHIDFYRLTDIESAESLGIEEAVNAPRHVVAVEWADMFPELMPAHTIWLRLSHGRAEEARVIEGKGMPNPA